MWPSCPHSCIASCWGACALPENWHAASHPYHPWPEQMGWHPYGERGSSSRSCTYPWGRRYTGFWTYPYPYRTLFHCQRYRILPPLGDLGGVLPRDGSAFTCSKGQFLPFGHLPRWKSETRLLFITTSRRCWHLWLLVVCWCTIPGTMGFRNRCTVAACAFSFKKFFDSI